MFIGINSKLIDENIFQQFNTIIMLQKKNINIILLKCFDIVVYYSN